MELSKILFGDPILPVFGVEKSQLAKNTTQESGYSPTFLSKYHIGDVVLGKILENLGNGKGTFVISGTVLAGYMPEYLMPNDVLSFQLQRSQTGEVALLLHSIPNSHTERTRFSPSQIASLLGIDSEDDSIYSAIQTLKNTGQPITKDAIYTLLRLVEEVRSHSYLQQQSPTAILSIIEDMLNEGIPLSAKNVALFAQSASSMQELEQSMKNLLQNSRLAETLPLRQSIIRWASAFLPVFLASTKMNEKVTLPKQSIEELQKEVKELGLKFFNTADSISATFSSLFSGHLTKSEEKIAVFELNKQLLQFLLSHEEINKDDVVSFLNTKQSFATQKNSTNENTAQALKKLHTLFLKYLAMPETTTIDLQIPDHQIQSLAPKLLLLTESLHDVVIEATVDQFIRRHESQHNEVFQQREHLTSIVKQLFTISENKQLPPATKIELMHSILRSEISTSGKHDALPTMLISVLQELTTPHSTVDVQMQKYIRANEMLFQKFFQDSSFSEKSFRSDVANIVEKHFPSNVRNSVQKEIDGLLQRYFNDAASAGEQNPTKSQISNVKEQFQQSYKETVVSAVAVLKSLLTIPENNRSIEQNEAIKNISIILSTMGAFETFNATAMEEHFPMYMLLPMILEIDKKRQFELKKIRIELHTAGDDKEMLQFGFSVPTTQLSEVNVRGSYLDKRITMQMFVESAVIKKNIEQNQNELMDKLQEHGYSVVSMSITTKEQHPLLPPLSENLKHDWRV
jgi:hypothetical protein